MLLTKEKILQTDDLPFEEIEVLEWGGTVRIKTLNGVERDIFEKAMRDINPNLDPKNPKAPKVITLGMKARLVAMSVVDESGNNLFSTADVEELNNKSGKVIDDIFQVSQKLNGLGDDELEDLRKNSSAVQEDGNGSNSQDK